MSKDALNCSCNSIPPYDIHTLCRKCRDCDFVTIQCPTCLMMDPSDVKRTLSSWRKADAKRNRSRSASLTPSEEFLEVSITGELDPQPHVHLQPPFDAFLQIAAQSSSKQPSIESHTPKRRHALPAKLVSPLPITPGRSLGLFPLWPRPPGQFPLCPSIRRKRNPSPDHIRGTDPEAALSHDASVHLLLLLHPQSKRRLLRVWRRLWLSYTRPPN